MRCLAIELFEAALSVWIATRCGEQRPGEIAIDGTTLRGSADGVIPGVHLLAAYAPQLDGALAQLRVDGKTNTHKAALELLKILPLKDAVVTADAMFTHADFSRAVLRGGGRRRLHLTRQGQPTPPAGRHRPDAPPLGDREHAPLRA